MTPYFFSAGVKKLVSIGLELLTDPLILFIDEPTINVDYFEAEKIVRYKRNDFCFNVLKAIN